MIRDGEFWEEESRAALLHRNAGFLTPQNAVERCEHAKTWVAATKKMRERCVQNDIGSIPAVNSPSASNPEDDPELEAYTRIFQLDAERTFASEEYRRVMVETLSSLYSRWKDYHQGTGFITAFLLLLLGKEDVIEILDVCNKYIVPGYFKAKAVNYFRDAKAFKYLVQQHFPHLYKKVADDLPPETYCSKWFVGFNIHVLNFEGVFRFLDGLFGADDGSVYLFRYGLGALKTLEPDLAVARGDSAVLAILRLDKERYADDAKVHGGSESLYTAIVDAAADFADTVDEHDVQDAREKATEEMAEAERRRLKLEAELEFDDEELWSEDEE